MPLVDLAGLPASRRGAEAARLTREEALRPFDLARGPLLRTALLDLGEAAHRALFTLHHIAADGWSVGVLIRELEALYGAAAAGRPSPLPELPLQYADYAVWQRGWLSGEVLAGQLAWWRERLAGMPEVLDLPADRPRPAVASLRGGSVPVALAPGLAGELSGLGARLGATPFMVLLAALAALLARLGQEERVVVGSPVANRTHREIEGLIGFFVNTLPLPADLTGEPPLASLLGQVRETALAAYARQDVPFEKLVEELAPRRSLSWSPLFQVMLVLQNDPLPRLSLPGLTAEPIGQGGWTEKFDLTLSLAPREEGLAGTLSYSADIFERVTAERFAGWFKTLLARALAEPDRRVSEHSLLAPEERRQLLSWSAGEEVWPAGPETTLYALFAAQAARTPAAQALVCGAERLSYGELAARAARLAAELRGLGVGPESRVGICLERGPALVVALLGVLAAAGAYVPLDPAYPSERLAWMLADSGAGVLLTQEDLRHRLPDAGVRTVLLDRAGAPAEPAQPRIPPLPAISPISPISPAVQPENLAYLIYTSGSTGTPKGVALTHRSAVALVGWARRAWSAEELSGVLFATSVCFDLSVFELFVPLASGGRVILAENALALPALPAAGEVTLVNTVPSALAELVRQGGLPASVRTVNLAGEALRRPLVEALYGLTPIAGLEPLRPDRGLRPTRPRRSWRGAGEGAPARSAGRSPARSAYVLDARRSSPSPGRRAGRALPRRRRRRPRLPRPAGADGGALRARLR